VGSCLTPSRNWEGGRLVKRLVCERHVTPLFRSVRKISGHQIKIMAFEEAKGELTFEFTIGDSKERFRNTVTFPDLIDLYQHGDQRLEAPYIFNLGGIPISSENDDEGDDNLTESSSKIAGILHPVIERLSVIPTALTYLESDVHRTRWAFRTHQTPIYELLFLNGNRAARCRYLSELGAPPPPWRPMVRTKLRQGGGAGRLLFRRILRRHGLHYIVTVIECGGPGGLLRVQVYDMDDQTTNEFRVPPIQRAFLLVPVGPDYISYTEDEAAQAFVSALLDRVSVSPDGTVSWDVRVESFCLDMPTFGEVRVSGGLDPKAVTFLVRIEMDGGVSKDVRLELPDVRAIAEAGGVSTDFRLDERYCEDPSFRSDFSRMVLGSLQCKEKYGTHELGLQVGDDWRALFLGKPEPPSSRPPRRPRRGRWNAPRRSDGGGSSLEETRRNLARPRVVKSLREKRLVERTLTTLQKVEEGLSGEVSYSVGQVEVRVWESYTGGLTPPERVYKILLIDHIKKGQASNRVVGVAGLQKVGPDPGEMAGLGGCQGRLWPVDS
jgi:hypothetical protein